MNYNIDRTQKIPAYMQLYHFIREDIISGVYPAGSRLPSKRTFAAETGLSIIPVEHALELLSEEGYIEARQRSGMFVIYRESDFQGTPGFTCAGTFTGGAPASGSKGDFPYSVMAKTMRRVIADYGERLLVKSPNPGVGELRSAISAYLARSRGMHVNPEQIIVGSGAEYLYGLIVQLLGNDRIYALENPSYEKIRRVYEAYGVKCDLLAMGENGIFSSELEKTSATVLHITPFNSFPSGVSADISKKQEYLRWAGMRGGYIIEDNFESELTVSKKAEDTVFSMTRNSNVIYVNTFSKTIAPSMRAGYMILPAYLSESYREKLGFYSCTVPVFDQYVLARLLESGDFERHVNRVRRERRMLAKQGSVK